MLTLTELATRCDLVGPVGLGDGKTWSRMIPLRAAWRNALVSLGGKRVAIHFKGTFDFTAALLGAWAAGCTVVIAGDTSTLTCAALAEQVDILIGEFPAMTRAPVWSQAPVAPSAANHEFPDLPLIVFTSGSTGTPLKAEKTLSALRNELQSLETTLGVVSATRVISTVSHQHFYGFLFRCLWPLASGVPFSDASIQFPEELMEALAQPGSVILVTSPSFLRHLPDAPCLTAGVPHTLAAIFSSGGPLTWPVAAACEKVLRIAPVEIYGSSETGGIAWRRRTAEIDPWIMFAGMKIARGAEGNLLVLSSPHMSPAQPFATADRIRLVDCGFELLGRSDNIVKLNEKRLSLSAMERLLESHPEVADAKLVILHGERESLGAVIRLENAEIPVRGSPLRNVLVHRLRDHLRQGFELVVLPRKWRFVHAMPATVMDKTVMDDLRALFAPQLGPVILKTRNLGTGATVLELHIPAELEWFRGHFPQAPLLPGVVQLKWAIEEGNRLYGPFGPFRALHGIKFQRPVVPGMHITLELARMHNGSGIRFTYESTQGRHASGQALFDS
jgi:acyl-coenzyme A synthetase/AMP-(fatty) acid ligase